MSLIRENHTLGPLLERVESLETDENTGSPVEIEGARMIGEYAPQMAESGLKVHAHELALKPSIRILQVEIAVCVGQEDTPHSDGIVHSDINVASDSVEGGHGFGRNEFRAYGRPLRRSGE